MEFVEKNRQRLIITYTLDGNMKNVMKKGSDLVKDSGQGYLKINARAFNFHK